jgi:protein-S-isoprenylcysteine O-methyltransferase Ste14
VNVERLEKPEGVWFLVAGHGVHALVLLLPSLLLAGIWELPFDVLLLAVAIVASAFLESRWTPVEGSGELTSTLVTPTPSKLQASDPLAIRVAWLVGATLLGLLWAAQIERLLCSSPIDPTWQLLGGLALLAGCGLRLSAIATLGPAFVSDICRCGPRVRRGIYAWIQHPSELGLVLLGSGGPLLVAAPRTTVAALMLLVPAALWRIRREELAWTP